MYSLMSMRTMRGLVVEQERGQRLGQLGLADARRAQEDERADRPVGVLQAGARAPHGRRRRPRPPRAGRPRAWPAPPPCAAACRARPPACGRPGCRSSARRLGDLVGRDGLLDHRALAVARPSIGLELLLQRRDDAVGQLAGARQIAAALRLLQLGAALVELHLELLGVAELAPSRPPSAAVSALLLLLELGDRLLEPRQAVLGGRVASPSSAPRARSSSA